MLNTSNTQEITEENRHDFSRLLVQYQKIRQNNERICAPLQTKDYGIQTIPEVSPPKWHLAHTTWFFETFLLSHFLPVYKLFNPVFTKIFNSYYNSVGNYHLWVERGLLARLLVAEVYQYRSYVDEHMDRLLNNPPANSINEIADRTQLGLNHEQQHQELMLTDIKHIFTYSPFKPNYHSQKSPITSVHVPQKWLDYRSGLYHIGNDGKQFGFDNEFP